MESNDDIWVIVPAYNEGERIADSLADLCAHYAHVVVVDDGSTDGSSEIAGQHKVFLLRHLINRGQGASLRTGLEFALQRGAQILVTFDADGQHVVEDIDVLVAPLRRGECDVVLGSRFLGSADGIPRFRRWILKAGVLFTRLFSRLRVTDTHNGLRAFSRTAAQKIEIYENGFAHASEILDEIHRHALRYVEVPVRLRYSTETLHKGQSSWSALRVAGQFLVGRILR